MCGIAGFVGGKWSSEAEQARTLAAMARSIRHRGPDHSAVWLDVESQVGFAHNRLAIIRRSPAGNQPMHSHSGRYVIVYNGEIYNHQELRKQLEAEGQAPNWAGHSDTETLLAAIEAWGLRRALEQSVGMFALALWDRRERELILARDRIGEKPLYYGRQSGRRSVSVRFGAEGSGAAPAIRSRDRSGGARPLYALQPHSDASFDLSRHLKTQARLFRLLFPKAAASR